MVTKLIFFVAKNTLLWKQTWWVYAFLCRKIISRVTHTMWLVLPVGSVRVYIELNRIHCISCKPYTVHAIQDFIIDADTKFWTSGTVIYAFFRKYLLLLCSLEVLCIRHTLLWATYFVFSLAKCQICYFPRK